MPDKVKRKTQVATNKNRQREPEFNTYLDFPLNIIEGLVNFRSLRLTLTPSTLVSNGLGPSRLDGLGQAQTEKNLKKHLRSFYIFKCGI